MLKSHGNTQGKLARAVKNMVQSDRFLEIVVEGSITERETKFLDRLLDLLHWDEALVDERLTRPDKAKRELNDAIAELKRFLKGPLKNKKFTHPCTFGYENESEPPPLLDNIFPRVKVSHRHGCNHDHKYEHDDHHRRGRAMGPTTYPLSHAPYKTKTNRVGWGGGAMGPTMYPPADAPYKTHTHTCGRAVQQHHNNLRATTLWPKPESRAT